MKRIFVFLVPLAIMTACNKDGEITVPDGGLRPVTPSSSPSCDRVFEYVPAPGQFIGEKDAVGDSSESLSSAADAAEWAFRRLEAHRYVSLGAFGGYIVVGFDHSIVSSSLEYDFLIEGNAFDSPSGSSNEPGVVWVMQDSNGNGRPDDTWYELKGSESGNPATVRDYSVTYYRPSGKGMAVEWKDSEGKTGTIDYLPAFHDQDSYYPAWIGADSYTLTGTRLEPRNVMDESTGFWSNPPYGWGYADNCGSDKTGNSVGFRISNAISPDGKPVSLDYIDFIKVQTAVMAKSGTLGELSTEVIGFTDYSLRDR